MKKDKKYLFIGIAVLSLFLSGCGTEIYELTAEEEELIVHSAAYIVAKHNIQQKDGVSGVAVSDDLEEESEESDTGSEDTESGTISAGGTDSETGTSEESISLAEIIGHENDLTVSYEGSYVADSYMEGSAYFVDAEEGKTFYVMKFKLTNTTGEAVKVDNASVNPIFKLVSDTVTVKSEVTFLTTDFSTYQGTIEAGESVETILLFEVSEAATNEIEAPILQITVGNLTKSVEL